MMRVVWSVGLVAAALIASSNAAAQPSATVPATTQTTTEAGPTQPPAGEAERANAERLKEDELLAELVKGGNQEIVDIEQRDRRAQELHEARTITDRRADRRDCEAIRAHTDLFRAFGQGDLMRRECALRLLETDMNPMPLGKTAPATDGTGTPAATRRYLTARSHVSLLEAFYSRRAQRQQTFMDTWSLITFIGAAGALSGNMSTHTEQSWATVAFAPSVVSQFNAYEPTRELYHAGAIGLQLITLRNDRINESVRMLTPPDEYSCDEISRIVSEVKRKREIATDKYDKDAVLLSEVQRLYTSCIALAARRDSISFALEYATLLQENMAREYVNNVITLDRALLARDRDLRFTTLETLAAIVASPLRAADFVITGENTKAAVDSFKTQIALTGLDMPLAAVVLPPLDPKAAVPAIATLSSAAKAVKVETSATDRADPVPDAERIALQLGRVQARQAFRERFVADLMATAAADQLTFVYEPLTRVTTVKLGAKTAPATIASGSTGTPLPVS